MTALPSPYTLRPMDATPTQGYPPSDARYDSGNGLARFLGYFSIGLGLAEIFAPRALARLTGVRQEGLLQVYGLREVVCGLGILSSDRPTGWLWARVAGDALDIATAGGNLAEAGDGRRERLVASAAALAGVTILDVACAAQLSA